MLAESLTGDHRRDFHTNHLLRSSRIRSVDEQTARLAAELRYRTGRASTLSATDALVVAWATKCTDPQILTSDPGDLRALAETAKTKTETHVTITQV